MLTFFKQENPSSKTKLKLGYSFFIMSDKYIHSSLKVLSYILNSLQSLTYSNKVPTIRRKRLSLLFSPNQYAQHIHSLSCKEANYSKAEKTFCSSDNKKCVLKLEAQNGQSS